MAVERRQMTRKALRRQIYCRVLQKWRWQLRMHSRELLMSSKASIGQNARNA